MARLDQTLLNKVANQLRKDPQYIREQVSRRASREGVASPAALVMWARDLGIGVASAVAKLPPHVQQQLAVPRVVTQGALARAHGTRRRDQVRKTSSRHRSRIGKWVFISHASDDRRLAGTLVEL